MTALDWVLVAVWAGITLAGFFKGAIRIVFGLGGFALGVWLAMVTGPELVPLVADAVPPTWLAVAIAHVLPWLVVTVLCAVAGWGMEKTLEALKLGCLNRLLGAAIAGAAAAVVLALLLLTAVQLSPPLAAVGRRSVVLEQVRDVVGGGAAAVDPPPPSDGDEPVDEEAGDGREPDGEPDVSEPPT
jgi:uncharacterized membrane protein required for colicin V production